MFSVWTGIREVADMMGIKKMNYAFQPVYDVSLAGDPKIIGHEALVRPPDMTPDTYIRRMINEKRTHELELTTFYNAITQFKERSLTGKLFINSFPYEYLSSEELDYLEELAGDLKKEIVIESLENAEEINVIKLAGKLAMFRERGYTIALDDFGSGINSARILKLYCPDIVKIDAHFVKDCTKSRIAANTVEIITELIRMSGAKVLAEGVETQEEYDYLKSLHVDYMQGYYLGIPA